MEPWLITTLLAVGIFLLFLILIILIIDMLDEKILTFLSVLWLLTEILVIYASWNHFY